MMQTARIKVVLAIFACLIVVILGLVQQYSIERLAYTMLIVVIMFYVLGSVIQYFVNQVIKNNASEQEVKLDQSVVIDPKEPITTEQQKNEVIDIKDTVNKINIDNEE